MFRTLVRTNLIKRFNHTHSKTVFTENNNKIIEDLLLEHNKHLDRIGDGIGYLTMVLFGIQFI